MSGKGVKKPASRSLGEPPLDIQTPVKPTVFKPTVSQTEPRYNSISRYSWTILQLLILFIDSQYFSLTFDVLLPCRVTLCKTPGCFLPSLSNPGNGYSQNFKQKKEELTSRLYQLYNTSVFDNKVIYIFSSLLVWALFLNVFCHTHILLFFYFVAHSSQPICQ